MSTVFNDKSIFTHSELHFLQRGKDIFNCCRDYQNKPTEPYVNKYGNLVYSVDKTDLLIIRCYLKRDINSAIRLEENLVNESYNYLFTGYLLELQKLPDYLEIYTMGIGIINGVSYKIQLLPVDQSSIQKIINPILGTRIKLRAYEQLIQRDVV
jgi:hypothetical protein